MSKTYKEKLASPAWKQRRQEVIRDFGSSCERCGENTNALQVHHGYYRRGADPWEYHNHHLHVLCDNCHVIVQRELEKLHRFVGAIHSAHISVVKNAIALLMCLANYSTSREVSRDDVVAFLGLPESANVTPCTLSTALHAEVSKLVELTYRRKWQELDDLEDRRRQEYQKAVNA